MSSVHNASPLPVSPMLSTGMRLTHNVPYTPHTPLAPLVPDIQPTSSTISRAVVSQNSDSLDSINCPKTSFSLSGFHPLFDTEHRRSIPLYSTTDDYQPGTVLPSPDRHFNTSLYTSDYYPSSIYNAGDRPVSSLALSPMALVSDAIWLSSDKEVENKPMPSPNQYQTTEFMPRNYQNKSTKSDIKENANVETRQYLAKSRKQTATWPGQYGCGSERNDKSPPNIDENIVTNCVHKPFESYTRTGEMLSVPSQAADLIMNIAEEERSQPQIPTSQSSSPPTPSLAFFPAFEVDISSDFPYLSSIFSIEDDSSSD